MRISLGLLIFWDLAVRATSLRAFYSDDGVLPRFALIQYIVPKWRISLHLMSGTTAVQAALFLLAGFFALLLIVGYRTRLATFVSWLLMSSLQVRNPLVLQASDRLFNLLLFWSLFLPLGARLSVDEGMKPTSRRRREGSVCSVGSVAYLAQIVVVYWVTAFRKLALTSPPVWREGLGVFYSLGVDQFVTPLGEYLLRFPLLLKVLNYGVLGFELLGPILLFMPWKTERIRTLTVTLFLLLQLSFGLCLEVGLFPWIASVAMLPFLPPSFWEKISPLFRRFEEFWKPVGNVVKERCDNTGRLLPRLARGFAGVCLAYILWWNAAILNPQYGVPRRFQWFGVMLGLDQRWAMFVSPPRAGGWFVVEGKLRNGTLVDLFREGQVLNWERPRQVSAIFKDQNWRKFMESLQRPAHAKAREYYSAYLCREWNAGHKGPLRLTEVVIYFVSQKTVTTNETVPARITRLSSYSCVPPTANPIAKTTKSSSPSGAKGAKRMPEEAGKEKSKESPKKRGMWPFR